MLVKLLATLMFLLSGFYKIVDPNPGVNKLQKILPIETKFIYYLILLAGLWELLASVLILVGNDHQIRTASYALVAFTVLVTALFHFPPTGSRYYPFMSNLSTISSLLQLASLSKL